MIMVNCNHTNTGDCNDLSYAPPLVPNGSCPNCGYCPACGRGYSRWPSYQYPVYTSHSYPPIVGTDTAEHINKAG